MFSIEEKSLYVADLDLWIDSMRPRERCYVSHGTRTTPARTTS